MTNTVLARMNFRQAETGEVLDAVVINVPPDHVGEAIRKARVGSRTAWRDSPAQRAAQRVPNHVLDGLAEAAPAQYSTQCHLACTCA